MGLQEQCDEQINDVDMTCTVNDLTNSSLERGPPLPPPPTLSGKLRRPARLLLNSASRWEIALALGPAIAAWPWNAWTTTRLTATSTPHIVNAVHVTAQGDMAQQGARSAREVDGVAYVGIIRVNEGFNTNRHISTSQAFEGG